MNTWPWPTRWWKDKSPDILLQVLIGAGRKNSATAHQLAVGMIIGSIAVGKPLNLKSIVSAIHGREDPHSFLSRNDVVKTVLAAVSFWIC
jgi:hypothetical protein